MMDKKERRKRKLREWLISLMITLVLLAAVVGFQFWLTDAVHTALEADAFWKGNIIGDVVGGLFLLLITHHFVRKPKDENDP